MLESAETRRNLQFSPGYFVRSGLEDQMKSDTAIAVQQCPRWQPAQQYCSPFKSRIARPEGIFEEMHLVPFTVQNGNRVPSHRLQDSAPEPMKNIGLPCCSTGQIKERTMRRRRLHMRVSSIYSRIQSTLGGCWSQHSLKHLHNLQDLSYLGQRSCKLGHEQI